MDTHWCCWSADCRKTHGRQGVASEFGSEFRCLYAEPDGHLRWMMQGLTINNNPDDGGGSQSV